MRPHFGNLTYSEKLNDFAMYGILAEYDNVGEIAVRKTLEGNDAYGVNRLAVYALRLVKQLLGQNSYMESAVIPPNRILYKYQWL